MCGIQQCCCTYNSYITSLNSLSLSLSLSLSSSPLSSSLPHSITFVYGKMRGYMCTDTQYYITRIVCTHTPTSKQQIDALAYFEMSPEDQSPDHHRDKWTKYYTSTYSETVAWASILYCTFLSPTVDSDNC